MYICLCRIAQNSVIGMNTFIVYVVYFCSVHDCHIVNVLTSNITFLIVAVSVV